MRAPRTKPSEIVYRTVVCRKRAERQLKSFGTGLGRQASGNGLYRDTDWRACSPLAWRRRGSLHLGTESGGGALTMTQVSSERRFPIHVGDRVRLVAGWSEKVTELLTSVAWKTEAMPNYTRKT